MAETSSSSNSSSSSSIDSRSSLSMSSSSSLSSSSSSTLSSLSSSSSSRDSSSSSSSSFMENKDDAMIGFNFGVIESKKINCFEYHNEYCFVASDGDNCVLRSRNRFSWEKYFQTAEENVSALKVFNGELFVGAYLNGTVYVVDLETNEQVNIETISNIPIKFFVINGQLYLACSNKPSVYKYDAVYKKFDLIYEPHAEVTDVIVDGNTAYLILNSENPIVFKDGKWSLLLDPQKDVNNISSLRNIKQEPFSNVSFGFLDRMKVSQHPTNEELIEVFPYRRNMGIKSSCMFGDSLFLGGKNFGRIIKYSEKTDQKDSQNLSVVFDTDLSSVHSIFTIDQNSIVASIGERLYIGYYGELKTKSPVISEQLQASSGQATGQATQQPEEVKNIKVKTPNGGETLQFGEEIVITWESNKSVADFVLIDLYKDDKQYYSINSRTGNTGSYIWIVPSSLPESGNYKVYIEWLSATANADSINKDISDKPFSIVQTKQQENNGTENATQVKPKNTKVWHFVPVLDLTSEYVSCISKDEFFGQILIGTSKGRILSFNSVEMNAYATGESKIYGMGKNEYGFVSDKQETNVLYGLVNKIVNLDAGKSIQDYIFSKKATILSSESISGIFISPIIKVKQDFGFWKDLIWEQSGDTETIIYLRASSSIEELYMKNWEFGFRASPNESNPISRTLMNTGIKGNYLQIKVEMRSITNNTSGSVSSISLNYSTKNASYFFTTKFSLENSSDLQRGLLTANITRPKNTEIYFGITDKSSTNWEEYQIIEQDKFFNTEKIENLKIGVKMISYDASLPEVSEFSLIMGGSKINKINLT